MNRRDRQLGYNGFDLLTIKDDSTWFTKTLMAGKAYEVEQPQDAGIRNVDASHCNGNYHFWRFIRGQECATILYCFNGYE